MINFYTLCKKLSQKRNGLYDTRVVSLTKKEYNFPVYFL